MSFRGGRGGRGFGRGKSYAENKPFVYFPPDVELPVVKSVSNDEIHLIACGYRLQRFWASSPYNLTTEEGSKKGENFPDKKNLMNVRKRKLSDFIKCGIDHVPAELAEGPSRSGQHIRKKVQWTQESDWKKLDLFEKLEQKYKEAKEDKDGKEEEEVEEVVEEEEEQEEESSDDDYNQNIDFDDDEDDYNMEDDGKDDEPIY